MFLLDRQRAIRYRGRVDDQYLVGIARNKPTRADLRLAIDELLAGKPVSVPQTDRSVASSAAPDKPNATTALSCMPAILPDSAGAMR